MFFIPAPFPSLSHPCGQSSLSTLLSTSYMDVSLPGRPFTMAYTTRMVISLSGTSTTTSSRSDPRNTGIRDAWDHANTASPHTLPVVPPQKMMLRGVEITTAVNPATQAERIAPGSLFPSVPAAHDSNCHADSKAWSGRYTSVMVSPVVKP